MDDNLNIIETFYGVMIKTTKDRQVMLLILGSIGKHYLLSLSMTYIDVVAAKNVLCKIC